jgi:alkylated DNA repair dioxygenase AlkB
MNSPIEYIENYTDVNICIASGGFITAFDLIKDEAVWEQRDAPRKECFMSDRTDGYTYGSGNGIRTYHPIAYPKTGLVFAIKTQLERDYACKFEACFLNYYEGPRDHLGWHADDSDVIDSTRPIAVISLGSAREIWFKENGTKGEAAIEKLLLKPGSLLLMKAGMQQTHQHRIPKHGANCGPRISLTFRGLK